MTDDEIFKFHCEKVNGGLALYLELKKLPAKLLKPGCDKLREYYASLKDVN